MDEDTTPGAAENAAAERATLGTELPPTEDGGDSTWLEADRMLKERGFRAWTVFGADQDADARFRQVLAREPEEAAAFAAAHWLAEQVEEDDLDEDEDWLESVREAVDDVPLVECVQYAVPGHVVHDVTRLSR